MLPEGWHSQDKSQCLATLLALNGSYQVIAVQRNASCGADILRNAGAVAVVGHDEARNPASGDFLTVFPVACRNLVVKTAICLQDDFESKWVAESIDHGRAVYMRKEFPLFIGLEPDAYKKKIISYYMDAERYGIQFDKLPSDCALAKEPALHGCTQKKRIVTASDLKNADLENELLLRPGDIITELARERAKELGIRICYMRSADRKFGIRI